MTDDLLTLPGELYKPTPVSQQEAQVSNWCLPVTTQPQKVKSSFRMQRPPALDDTQRLTANAQRVAGDSHKCSLYKNKRTWSKMLNYVKPVQVCGHKGDIATFLFSFLASVVWYVSHARPDQLKTQPRPLI